ncbi:hypothetical protein OIV83_005626 [Microbotryomycetes sp. JL201]|nr:hypothetical protein OIV83_005626 [Microbotryomycetes sp. JL201]
MPTATNETRHDVLIVGAGPVGLLLALKLKQQGVDVAIAERQRALYPLPRAVAFDHESRRNLYAVGLREQLDAILQLPASDPKTGKMFDFAWRDAKLEMIVPMRFDRPTASGLPFCMAFHQPSLEALLEREVRHKQIPLYRGLQLVALEQDKNSVTTTFQPFADPQRANSDSDSDRSIGINSTYFRAKYVVGCDGANSAVRKLAGFTTTEIDFENDWLIADIIPKDGFEPATIATFGFSQICDPTRPTTVALSGFGRKRLEFMRMADETRAELLDKTWNLLERWGYHEAGAGGNTVLERKVVYTFKARWANEFAIDRVSLAGDALHLMPPFIGQGLNSGLRDASALAWRLPFALQSATPERLFSSYESERKAHVVTITKFCIALGQVICETDPAVSDSMHESLRASPPPDGIDPPLGPGILTKQPLAGQLSLQRRVVVDRGRPPVLFDEAFGYGWMLLSLGRQTVEAQLAQPQHEFFVGRLGGKFIALDQGMDIDGEYHRWFETSMTADSVVLIRPDFYVFGSERAGAANELVCQLQEMMGI